MGDVLAFAEQRDGQVRGVANEAVSAAAGLASTLGGAVHALILGGPGAGAGAAGLGAFGASTVHVGETDAFASYSPEAMAHAIAERIRSGGYRAVLFSATAQGKDLAPRVAALLDVPLAADVTGVAMEGDTLVVTRPMYAGKAISSVAVLASPGLVSLRPNAFPAKEHDTAASVEAFTPQVPDGLSQSRVVEFRAAEGGQLDVAEATTVVSGGRGMKDPENWNLLRDLRDALGTSAGLGASRAVVDAGWRPHGEQVGQTGKTVAPKLYIAVGISGAIQHLAGMRTAGTIVAINKDADAPIFQVADYGLVGDLFEIVPRLTNEIRTLRAGG